MATFDIENATFEDVYEEPKSQMPSIKPFDIESATYEDLYGEVKTEEARSRTKLDSNGSNPQVLENLLQNELVDYIAMDIKGTQDQYKEITKFSDVKKIQSSIDLIQTMKEYEFRTTVIPLYHNQKKLLEIGEWIKGSNLYALQQFRPDLEQGCLDKKFEQEPTYSQKELNAFGEILKPYFKEVKIRCRQGG